MTPTYVRREDVAEAWEQVARHRERKGDAAGAAQARVNAEIVRGFIPYKASLW